MKLTLAFLGVCVLSGCSQGSTRPSPVAPGGLTHEEVVAQTTLANLWTMVIDGSGQCIEGAVLEVVAGQAVGQVITQTTPCDMWDVGGGAMFSKLVPYQEMTIRAVAPGYSPQEKSVQPYRGPQQALFFELTLE